MDSRGRVLQAVFVSLWVAGLAGLPVVAQTPVEDAIERYAEEGQTALAQGNYPEAEKAYEKLRELQPAMAEVHANLGLIYFQEKKFEQAVPALRQALKLKSSLPRTETLLAISLSELGRYEEALPGLEKAFRQSSDPAIRRMCGLQLLRAYTGLRRDSQAVQTSLELNRLYGHDPEVLYHTGRIYGNFAFLTIQKLAQVAPGSVWRHQAEAEANESLGNYDAAMGEYRQVLAIDPQRPGIHYRIGRTLLARSRQSNSAADVVAAAREFEQELQIDPGSANAAYELGEIHRNAGEFPEAQRFFEAALEHYPDFAEAHLGLASVLTSLRRPELALPHLQKAVALDAGNEVGWYRLSQVQGMLGHSAEQKNAFAEFRRLRDLKSREQEAGKQLFSPEEVTRQQLDAGAPR